MHKIAKTDQTQNPTLQISINPILYLQISKGSIFNFLSSILEIFLNFLLFVRKMRFIKMIIWFFVLFDSNCTSHKGIAFLILL